MKRAKSIFLRGTRAERAAAGRISCRFVQKRFAQSVKYHRIDARDSEWSRGRLRIEGKEYMREKIQQRIDQAIRDHVFPGCVVGVVFRNGERIVIPRGKFTDDPESPNVTENSVFDVASLTKCIPTSSLALQLLDTGKLHLDDPLIQFVPEFRNSSRDRVRIRHLLTQTLDFGFRLSSYRHCTPEELFNIIFTMEFTTPPGTRFSYSNATSILLGLVVERIMGDSLDHLGERYFFAPLGMSRTTFHPLQQFPIEEIVPTEVSEWRGGLIQGKVHDDSAFTLSQSRVVGSAGLFSTAPDILTWMEMLLHNGTLYDKQYFSPAIIERMHTNQLTIPGECTGLGWELQQPWFMGTHCSTQTFGKTGFTGCSCACEPERKVAWVILSNATFPTRKTDKEEINAVRRDISDIVLAAEIL